MIGRFTWTLALMLAAGPAIAGRPGERILIRVDADPVDFCLYDGRPYSEGAYIDSPRGVLVCSYRERDAISGEAYMPSEGGRRLKWLQVEVEQAEEE